MKSDTCLSSKRRGDLGKVWAVVGVLTVLACGRLPGRQGSQSVPYQPPPPTGTEHPGETVADLGVAAYSICGDDAEIFASTRDGRVVRIDPASGTVSTAYTAPAGYFARELTCTRTRVFFEQGKQFVEDGCVNTPGCGLSIQSMPRAGGPPEQLLAGTPVMRLAVDGDNLYWTETHPLWDAQWTQPWKLRTMPLDGGQVRDLFAGAWIQWSFAIDATSVWLLASTDGASRQGTLLRVPKDGGAAESLDPIGLPLFVQDGALFVATSGAGFDVLGSSAPAGTFPEAIHELTPSPYGDYGVTVGDGGVYILLVDELMDCSGGGAARVVHVTYDGTETVLVSYTDFSGTKGPVLLTDKWFYWLGFSNTRLVRVPRVAVSSP